MKAIVVVAFGILALLPLAADSADPGDAPLWVQLIGGRSDEDEVLGGRVHAGGMTVVGTTRGFGVDGTRIPPGLFLASLSHEGAVLDIRAIAGIRPVVSHVVFTKDGGFVVLGLDYETDTSRLVLSKFDRMGAIDWQRQLPALPGSGGRVVPVDLAVGAGSELLVAWASPPPGDGAPRDGRAGPRYAAALYESGGALRWQKNGVAPFASAVALDGRGNAYVAFFLPRDPTRGPLVRAFDARGRERWTSTLIETPQGVFAGTSDLATGADGTVCGTGLAAPIVDNSFSGWPDVAVGCVTSAGRPLWSTVVGDADWDWGRGLTFGPQGRLFVTGTTESPSFQGHVTAGDEDFFLLEFDRGGALLASQVLGGVGPDVASHVLAGVGGAVYVAGSTTGPVFGGRRTRGPADIAVVRFR